MDLGNVLLFLFLGNHPSGHQLIEQVQFVLLALVQGLLEIFILHLLGFLQEILAPLHLLAQVFGIGLRLVLLRLFCIAELRVEVGTLAHVGEFYLVQAPLILLFGECTLQVFALGGSVGLGFLPRDVLHTILRFLLIDTSAQQDALLFELVPFCAAFFIQGTLLGKHFHFYV